LVVLVRGGLVGVGSLVALLAEGGVCAVVGLVVLVD
jgi:hypothetical protein